MFWRENAAKLNDRDFEQLRCAIIPVLITLSSLCASTLRILVKLLKESDDPTVLAVAVHDIGQYVKHYGRGKKSETNPDSD
jgi:V-type H+-transporting ATPase subunit H